MSSRESQIKFYRKGEKHKNLNLSETLSGEFSLQPTEILIKQGSDVNNLTIYLEKTEFFVRCEGLVREVCGNKYNGILEIITADN